MDETNEVLLNSVESNQLEKAEQRNTNKSALSNMVQHLKKYFIVVLYCYPAKHIGPSIRCMITVH